MHDPKHPSWPVIVWDHGHPRPLQMTLVRMPLEVHERIALIADEVCILLTPRTGLPRRIALVTMLDEVHERLLRAVFYTTTGPFVQIGEICSRPISDCHLGGEYVRFGEHGALIDLSAPEVNELAALLGPRGLPGGRRAGAR